MRAVYKNPVVFCMAKFRMTRFSSCASSPLTGARVAPTAFGSIFGVVTTGEFSRGFDLRCFQSRRHVGTPRSFEPGGARSISIRSGEHRSIATLVITKRQAGACRRYGNHRDVDRRDRVALILRWAPATMRSKKHGELCRRNLHGRRMEDMHWALAVRRSWSRRDNQISTHSILGGIGPA